jgi:alpha-2-macroglobulin
LTRSGVVTSNLLIDLLSSLNKQHKNQWQKDILSTYIAASYSLMQQQSDALKLLKQYDLSDDNLRVEQAFAGLAPRLNLDAQYLYLVAKHFPKQLPAVSEQAVLNITQAIYKGEYNTVSAAYSMLALGAYHAALVSADQATPDKLRQIAFLATSSASQSATQLTPKYTPFASAAYPTGTQRVQAELPQAALTQTGALYYMNMQAGFQSELPSKALSNGIEIQRSFLHKNGDVALKISQGDELVVKLRVRSVGLKKINNVAIVDLLPGGFEVLRESLKRQSDLWQSDYIDVREDRIVFYGDITNRVTEITYHVKVTAAGDFSVPPSFVEAMYDRSLSAYSAASRLQVDATKK